MAAEEAVLPEGFLLVAFTPETPAENEAAKICLLLDGGFHRVHLRHPNASKAVFESILEEIPEHLLSRITIHDCFALAERAGGIHLNTRHPEVPDGFGGIVSRSCHSEAEVLESVGKTDYVTLSPVFDSISKTGYTGRGFKAPADASVKVIALGGVTPSRLPDVIRAGYGGAAMLGAIPWGESAESVKQFCETIKNDDKAC